MPNQADKQDSCRQCGTCCRKGGPALHREDAGLIEGKLLKLTDLITMRRGEPAYSPAENKVVVLDCEIIKLKGQPGSWSCCFFDEPKSACTIYDKRPLECRLLKCWDPADLLAAINRDTLCRRDLLGAQELLADLITHQEQLLPAEAMADLMAQLLRNEQNNATLEQLTILVRRDLEFRQQAVPQHALSPALELFILGRPLFTLLDPLGIEVRERNNELFLQWRKR